jgi:hypothetical protein
LAGRIANIDLRTLEHPWRGGAPDPPRRINFIEMAECAAGTYQTLVFGVIDGDNSDVVAFGKLDDGKAPTATRS